MIASIGEPASPLLVTVAASAALTEKAGMGFLIDSYHVLTCAHVIYDGGWVTSAQKNPNGSPVSITVQGRPRQLDALIIFISTPDEGGEIDLVDDICLLELSKPIDEFDSEAFPLTICENFDGISVRTLGVPQGSQIAGKPIKAETLDNDLLGRIVLTTEGRSDNILPGFSGAPVIRHGGREVLGMVVSREKGSQRAFMLPINLIAKCVLRQLPEFKFEICSPAERDYPHLSTLRSFAKEFLDSNIKRIAVESRLAPCDTYEKLARIHRGAEVTETKVLRPRDLLRSKSNLRIYIQAPGGAGKTAYLMQFLLQAINNGLVPFYLDVKNAGNLGSDEQAVELLFQRCTQGGGSFEVFNKAKKDSTSKTLLMVDGLNENRESMQRVRDILNEVWRNNARLHIVSADRLTGSSALPEGFTRATILPINLDEIADERIKRTLASVKNDKFRKLLTLPFFLDMYVQLSSARSSSRGLSSVKGRAGILRQFFLHQLRGAAEISKRNIEEAMQTLARLAFESYSSPQQGLRILRGPLELGLKDGQQVVERLVTAGVLIEDDDRVLFRHQLLHDFLVAEHLKKLGSRKWRSRIFDVATFGAGAFEALEFTTELLDDSADDFIIDVYDWSYAAALECLLNLDAGNTLEVSPISNGLRDALLAQSAEKRFDYFQNTREKAQRKADQFSLELPLAYATIPSRDALVEEVRKHFQPTSLLLQRWLELFCFSGRPAPENWPVLQDSPLLAWTAANSFRRRPRENGGEFTAYLCALYQALRFAQVAGDRAMATRWRIVHILGTADDKKATEILISAVGDSEEGHWVRYGAARSLIEAASRCEDSGAARDILANLKVAMPGLLSIPAFQEVCDVAILADIPPEWWAREYASVLERGISLLTGEAMRLGADPISRQRVLDKSRAWDRQLRRLKEVNA